MTSGITTTATAPKVLTVRHEGKTVDAVAQVSKQGISSTSSTE